jgi:hypothetical protein
MSKNIDKKNETNVTPFDIAEMEADSGLGLGQIKDEDLALPFIKISDGNDAPKGAIWNDITGEVLSGTDGILVVPCYYQRRYVEWAPKESKEAGSGAPINIFTPEDKAAGKVPPTELRPGSNNDRTDWIVGSENYIENTAYHYVVRIDDQGLMEPGLITMKKTGLKKSRGWNSMMSSRIEHGKSGPFRPPSFAYVYHLTTELQQKESYKWHLWKITLRGNLADHCSEPGVVYSFAKSFASSVEAGDMVVKHETEGAGTAETATAETIITGDEKPSPF